MKNKRTIIGVLMIWVLIISFGWGMLSRYENTPGRVKISPGNWPLISQISRSADLPMLVMFIHPHCPCSRASIKELSLIMTHVQNKVKTKVIFIRPEKFTEDWVKSDLWRSASQIPGVEVMIDNHGKESKIFHADVSGQTMLYDSQGHLIFSGGITSSRGHEGDNDGKDAIINFLTKGIILQKQTPAFGCLLADHQKKSFNED